MIGPNSSVVGLSSLNGPFNAFISGLDLSIRELADKLGDVTLYFAILLAVIILVLTIIQFIQRKSLFKVDKELLFALLGFIIVVLFYAIFEFVIINYRPILDDGELKASFPSSHTLISISIYLIVIQLGIYYFKEKKLIRNILIVVCSFLAIIALLLRLLSGQHWLTDILGGLLLAISIYFGYRFLIRK